MNALVKYVRGVESLVRGLGIAAMYLLLVILAVLMFPVFARGSGINTIWALEMAQFAVGAYYLLGAGWTLQRGAHVRMDFLYANWKPRTKAIVDAVTSFFVLFYLVVMLLGGWDSWPTPSSPSRSTTRSGPLTWPRSRSRWRSASSSCSCR